MYWGCWELVGVNEREKFTLLNSFGCAFAGIRSAVLTQRNMKIHVGAAMSAVALGHITQLSALEWLVLGFTITSVIVMELVNTAVEAVVDLVSQEFHPLAKIAKDTAAAAVLITALFSLVVGAVLFVPKLILR